MDTPLPALLMTESAIVFGSLAGVVRVQTGDQRIGKVVRFDSGIIWRVVVHIVEWPLLFWNASIFQDLGSYTAPLGTISSGACACPGIGGAGERFV